MFDEAVAVGVAAFLDGEEPPSDEAVLESLRTGGVESWLAERLLIFLPLAFGRQLLKDVDLSDSFQDGPVPRALGDEPVFLAAAARARHAIRTEIERIGLRSSEVSAVNDALVAGSKITDLSCGPMALAYPLSTPEAGDGGVSSPRAAFASLLQAHGHPVDGTRAGDLEIDARVFPHPRTHPESVMVQVDFLARHPALAQPWLVESFAGFGGTWRDAIGQCIVKFERCSLHPIIATLLDRDACQDQVEWDRYEHPEGAFECCLGPQLTLYTPQTGPSAGPLVDTLLAALRGEPLSPAVHSLRIFTCHEDGVLRTNEVLLDGEPWKAGEAVVTAAAPPQVPGPIGVRVFGLLKPVTEGP